MKKCLLTALILLIIACDNSDPEFPADSSQLKKRLVLLTSYGPGKFYVSDSIIESYSNNVISNSEYHIRQYGQPYKSIFVSYEFDGNQVLLQRKLHTDKEMTNLYSTVTYSYNPDQSIKSIVAEKFKPSNISDNLYHYTELFEYKGDSVKTSKMNHLDGDLITKGPSYVFYGNMDSIKYVERNTMYYFDSDKDLSQRKYLGDPQDVGSWQSDMAYGNERIPVFPNFLGTNSNIFLITDPIPYFSLEQTHKYRESEFIHTHRTNENIIYNYIIDSEQRPIEFYRTGTFYPGDKITYYFE